MSQRETNYIKALFTGNLNMAFIGVMVFLSLVFNWGFLFLLLAGELGLLILSQAGFVQRWLDENAEKQWRKQLEQAERKIVESLAPGYQQDYQRVRHLCEEIEKRAAEMISGNTSHILISGIVEKLSSFRTEYARILRAHSLLANRNYKEMQKRLDSETARVEREIEREKSAQVRATLMQNLKILRQRSSKLHQLDELVRLLEARIQVVRNSLQLIQDEVYSLTNVHSISEIVDGMLINLELSDEYRAYYNDVLNTDLSMENDVMKLEPEFPPQQQVHRPKVRN